MSTSSLSLSLSEEVVVGVVGVGVAKRGRPARGKVVKEVDWLVGLSSGSGLEVVPEVRQELELVVVGGAKETKKRVGVRRHWR